MNKNRIFKKVSFAIIVFALVVGCVVLYQTKTYNNGVLEIYASQQDQYIKLVLDQINLKKDTSGSGQKMIRDILGSIDGSEKEYWTLSKEDSLLFVKDVTESDRYRGLSTASYYVSESGRSFLNSLEKNKVKHRFISQSGKKYIASGVFFEVNGHEYKICLLTNEKYIINNNEFMQAQIIILIGVVLLVLMLLVVSMIMAGNIDKKQSQIDKLNEQIQNKNLSIEKIESELSMLSEYDVKNTVFKEKIIDRFMEKLENKNITSVRFETVVFSDAGAYDISLKNSQWMLDKKTLKFEIDSVKEKNAVMLVFIGHSANEVKNIMQMIIGVNDKCLTPCEWRKSDKKLKEYCNDYLNKIIEQIG